MKDVAALNRAFLLDEIRKLTFEKKSSFLVMVSVTFYATVHLPNKISLPTPIVKEIPN